MTTAIQLDEVRSLASAGKIDDARMTLARLSADHIEVTHAEPHIAMAYCSMELGLTALALRELNLILRDHPQHEVALQELAELHRDRGEFDKELRARERLESIAPQPENQTRLQELTAPPVPPEPRPNTPVPQLADPSDADVTRLLHMVGGRENVHARMWYAEGRGSGYSPVRQPLTPTLLRAHFEGSLTLGVYPVRIDNTVTFFAFDIDIVRSAVDRARGDREETRRLRKALRETSEQMCEAVRARGLPFVFIDSGYKGRHLWFFLAEPLPADLVRRFAVSLANATWRRQHDLTIEVFPKQSAVSADVLGNLIKLPLGIHLRSGRRSWVLDDRGQPLADPWELLRNVPRLRREQILDALTDLRDAPPAESDALDPLDDDVHALPQPAPVPDRSWTHADFETHPEMSAMLGRCPVLKAIVDKGLEQRRLSHDEQTVLRHTLGHVPAAVPGVNYVFQRCPEVPPSMLLQSPLRGSPISCPKIRKRIPEVTATVPCFCEFTVAIDHYPTPVLHLEEARARGELVDLRSDDAPVVVENVARTYAHLMEQRDRIEEEVVQTRQLFLAQLRKLPGRRLMTAEGDWVVEDEEGFEVIVWHAAATGGTAAEGAAEEE